MLKRSPLSEKVILIADRGYEAYNNLAHLQEKGWNYVIRVKACDIAKGILSKTDLPSGQEFDETVSVLMTRRQTNEIKSSPKRYRFLAQHSTFDFLPVGSKGTYRMTFRVVCVEIEKGKFQYLVTNLGRDFSMQDIKYLYHKRWGIETYNRINAFQFKKGGAYQARNLRKNGLIQLLRDDYSQRCHQAGSQQKTLLSSQFCCRNDDLHKLSTNF